MTHYWLLSIGQSNGCGSAVTQPSCGAGHWKMGTHGFIEPLDDGAGKLSPNIENQPRSIFSKAQSLGASPPRYGMWGSLCDTLKAALPSDTFGIIPCASGGTTSSNWEQDIATIATPPPSIPTPGGGNVSLIVHAVYLTLHALASVPNSELLAVVVWQGEYNANAFDVPAGWRPDWGAVFDALPTLLGNYFTNPAKWIALIDLFATPPASGYPNWAAVRTEIAAEAAARSTCTLITPSDGPRVAGEDVHSDSGTPGVDGLCRTGELVAGFILTDVLGL